MEFLRRSQRYYFLKFTADGLLLAAVFLVILHGKFGLFSGEVPRVVWVYGILFLGSFWTVSYLRGDYSPRIPRRLADSFAATLTTFFLAFASALVVTTFLVAHHISRMTLGLLFLVGFPLEATLRYGFAHFTNQHLEDNPPRVLFAGASPAGQQMARRIEDFYGRRIHILGFLDDGSSDLEYPVLGGLDDLKAVCEDRDPDTLFISISDIDEEELFDLIDRARNQGLGVKILSELFDVVAQKVAGTHWQVHPIVDMQDPPFRRTQRLLKRSVDVSVALTLLVLSAPCLALIALAIKLDSSGPVLYTDKRYRNRNDIFTIYKFRTMVENADEMKEDVIDREVSGEDGDPFYKAKHDPRITRVGRWLRRFSLDELPQLLNVLVGDMSLVGPRPPALDEEAVYEEWHRRRLDGKPGITGLWQVSGRNELSLKERVLLDVYYLENWTLLLDLKILLKTIPAALSGRGAY